MAEFLKKVSGRFCEGISGRISRKTGRIFKRKYTWETKETSGEGFSTNLLIKILSKKKVRGIRVICELILKNITK